MRIHYLQHVSFENPGSILEWAKANNGMVTSTQLYNDEALPDVKEFDWLVVMGGPMNIYEEEQYPWLKAEKALIKAAIEANKVVLGMCLGSQLIADIIGGSGGNMEGLFQWCKANTRAGGRVIANFVTLENAAQATTLMNQYFENVELIQVGISRGEGIGGLTMLKAANPIFIITGDVN